MSQWKEINDRTITENRKAWHEYHVLDTVEAGIKLQGTEIKSIRDHKVHLNGSYARIELGEVWLIDCTIDEYSHKGSQTHEPKRKKKLLLHKNEIRKFAEKAQQTGHTLIPLKLYLSKGKAKIELAVCKGKRLHDKRQALKEREAKREMQE